MVFISFGGFDILLRECIQMKLTGENQILQLQFWYYDVLIRYDSLYLYQMVTHKERARKELSLVFDLFREFD